MVDLTQGRGLDGEVTDLIVKVMVQGTLESVRNRQQDSLRWSDVNLYGDDV